MVVRLQDPRQQLNLQAINPTTQGAINTVPQTNFSPDSFMPEFIARAMEPYIQRKQEENMVRGYMDQKRVGVRVELVNDDNPISKIWGPTGYEQGANFYRAQEKVSDAMLGFASDIDQLKRLRPEDFNKEVMKRVDGLKTGNEFTDGMVQKAMMEKLGDVATMVEKARISWMQGEAKTAQVSSLRKAASEYHGLAAVEFSTSDPDKQAEARRKTQTARVNFLGLIGAKPDGQLDSTYQDGVNDAARGMIEDGNFYAYREIRAALPELLGYDRFDKLDNLYQVRGATALRDAANSPAMIERMAALDARIGMAELGDKKPITPMEVAAELASINGDLSKATGIDQDLFDYKEIKAGVKSVLTARFDYEKRLLNQAQQAAERRADMQDKLMLKQAEAELITKRSDAALSMGGITAALGRGEVELNVLDGLATQDVQAGKYDRIIGRYEGSDRRVFQGASNALRAPWSAALGKGYTNDLDNAVKAFREINSRSAGTAVAYYGVEDYAKISKMVTLLDSGVSKLAAWEHVYADSKVGKPEELSYEDRSALSRNNGALLNQAISKADPGGILSGLPKWNDSARTVLKNAVRTQVGLLRKNSSMSLDSATSAAVNQVIASGRVGVAGPFAWDQAPGTKPLAEAAGMDPSIFSKHFTEVADARLKAAGYEAGAKGNDFSVHRTPSPRGDQITIFAMKDGKEHVATFTVGDVQARAIAVAKGKILGEEIQRSILHGGITVKKVKGNPNDPYTANGYIKFGFDKK